MSFINNIVRFKTNWFFVCFMMLFFNGHLKAQETDYKSYALYVYNFMKYIEWPESQSADNFVIGLFGDSPISNEFKVLAAQKKIKGRTIVFKQCKTIDEAAGCQLLYVTSSKSSSIKTLDEKYKDKSILIVGERDGTVYKGASISFTTTDEDELKFEINKKNIDSHKLKISSSLIKLGTVVK